MRDLNVWVSVLKGWSCCSVSVLCPTLWGPMDSSLPDFSVCGLFQARILEWVAMASSSSFRFMSIELVMPSNHLTFCCPLFLLPLVFLSIRVFSSQSALRIQWPKIGTLASASVFPMNILVWSPCCPKDSRESPPALQLESISFLVLSLLYGPSLTSVLSARMETWV